MTVPAGVKLPVDVRLDPVNLSSTPVPSNVGCVDDALVMPVAMVWLENEGSVTAVGVFAVNSPALQPMVRVSFATEVVREGRVQAAAEPAVTEPPPVAEAATYLLTVLGVTVIVGVDTEPAGV